MKPFRCPPLLDLIRLVPHCMHCGVAQDGSVVPCHANSQEFDKGMGIKASDAPIAALCSSCHDIVDGRKGIHLSKLDREWILYRAACKTWLYLMRNGHLEVK